MARLALDLPDDTARWAQSRVEAGDAPSLEAYVADILRREQERAEEEAELQAAIDKGLASGVDPRPPRQIFAEVRRKYFGPDA